MNKPSLIFFSGFRATDGAVFDASTVPWSQGFQITSRVMIAARNEVIANTRTAARSPFVIKTKRPGTFHNKAAIKTIQGLKGLLLMHAAP
jgi:hypothetical protein